jgi:prevent-host-death family protein
MAAKRKSKSPSDLTASTLPLARVKVGFSRYVREVQMYGRALTITQHGRPAAMLVPVTTTAATLNVRQAIDGRPLGALTLRPAAGNASIEAIHRALDAERAD